jgi:hypothetical protein
VERHNLADLRRYRDRTLTGLDALAPMRTANRSENGDILARSGWGVVRLPATFCVGVVPGQGWRLRHHAVTRSGLDVVLDDEDPPRAGRRSTGEVIADPQTANVD